MATEVFPTATTHLANRWSTVRFAASAAGVVLANLVVSLITHVVADVPSTFVPLRPAAVVIVSVLAVLAIGAARWAAVRWAPRPRVIFTAAVSVGFLVSMLPVLGTEMGDADPGLRSPNAIATLAVATLHVIPTWFALGPIRRRTPLQRSLNDQIVAEREV